MVQAWNDVFPELAPFIGMLVAGVAYLIVERIRGTK